MPIRRVLHRSVGALRLAPPEGPAQLVDSTLTLLQRARAGDAAALDALIGRFLPRLQRWATGRLPGWAREMADTHDLVQETVVQAFKKIETFEVRGDGALQAYLRQVLLNRIRQEIRRVGRRPETGALDSQMGDAGPSPLEAAIGSEAVERYEAALARLRPQDREVIVGHVELGLTKEELAAALGKPSANAARMAVERALFRLAREMNSVIPRQK